MELAENTVVAGRFRLKRLIGKGGMGSVWEAAHLRLDIPCAVKFMDVATIKEAHARFEREAKAAAQLRSPHVVQILDHGLCEDGTPYIAMELLDGEELGKRLQRVGRLSPPELVQIVAQVSRALTKAHSLGIVHRDLKPDNIFIVRDDDREIAKVLDFGIAKNLGNDISGSSTKTGAMLGTPFYMSPEQAQGTKQVDGRSDLWAMAIICFEAITGRRPFVSDALGDLLIQIIVTPLPMPSQYAQVPPGFDAWWTRAASRDPAQRFQTAKEFADSLALVCGISQVGTDMGRGGGPGQTMAVTPTPQNRTPNPNNQTPSPHNRTPPPYNQSPAPTFTPRPVTAISQAGVPGTGAGVARSSPSISMPPPGGSKAGLVFGVIGGGIILVAGVVGVALMMRPKPPDISNGGVKNTPAELVAPASSPGTSTPPPGASTAPDETKPPTVASGTVTLAPVESTELTAPSAPPSATKVPVPGLFPRPPGPGPVAPPVVPGPPRPPTVPTVKKYNPGI